MDQGSNKDIRIRIEAPQQVSDALPSAVVGGEAPSKLDFALLFLTFAFSGLSLYLSFFTR